MSHFQSSHYASNHYQSSHFGGFLAFVAEAEATGGWERFRFDRIRKRLPRRVTVDQVVSALEAQPTTVRQLPQVPEIVDVLRGLDRDLLVSEIAAEVAENVPEPEYTSTAEIDRALQLEYALIQIAQVIEDEVIARLLLDAPVYQTQPDNAAEILLLLD